MSPVFTIFITFKLWTVIVFSFLSYSYNCLSPQLVLKLIEAGARVYCIKNFSALTHVIMSSIGWETDNISEYLLPRIERYSNACRTNLHENKEEKFGVVITHTFPLYIVLLVCLAAPSVPADPTTSPTCNKRSGLNRYEQQDWLILPWCSLKLRQ